MLPTLVHKLSAADLDRFVASCAVAVVRVLGPTDVFAGPDGSLAGDASVVSLAVVRLVDNGDRHLVDFAVGALLDRGGEGRARPGSYLFRNGEAVAFRAPPVSEPVEGLFGAVPRSARLRLPLSSVARARANDPWSVLGVRRDASARELRRAYRSALMANHPDRVSGDRKAEAEAATRRINEAWEAIKAA